MTVADAANAGGATTSLAFFLDLEPPKADFRADVLKGLSETPKTLAAKHLYDERGSALFEAITEAPEYYIPRVETQILRSLVSDLAKRLGPRSAIIEAGAGASTKVRILLDGLDRPAVFAAIDISGDHLCAALRDLAPDFPDVRVGGIAADFTAPLILPDSLFDGAERRLVFFPGSTIGNFDDETVDALLASIRGLLRRGDLFLVGADLKKDKAILEPAYDDAQGVTAEFILNVLVRINAELGGDFDLSAFAYRSRYAEARGRIEMEIESLKDQRVRVSGRDVAFAAGERIVVSHSRKFEIDEFQTLAARARFAPLDVWVDDEGLFSVHLFEAG